MPGALCLQDLAQLRTFIIRANATLSNAQQRRIAELLEDNELRRQGSKLQVEQLEKYLRRWNWSATRWPLYKCGRPTWRHSSRSKAGHCWAMGI